MKINNFTLRILAAATLAISLVWGFWWLTWSLAIVFLFLFSSYYEIIGLGIAYDALYGLPLPSFYNFPYVFTVTSFVLYILSHYIRKKLTVYDDV